MTKKIAYNGSDASQEDATHKFGARGLAKRQQLLDLARHVFEDKGFIDARLVDMADLGNVPVGSFYTYFDSKDHLFQVVVEEAIEAVYRTTFRQNGYERANENTTLQQLVAATNERYYDAWAAHARLLTALDQVAEIRPEFNTRLTDYRQQFITRFSRVITAYQERGEVSPDIDARHTAAALAAMTEQSMRWWLSRGEPHEKETALATLDRLWIAGIGLQRDSPVQLP